MKLCISSQWDNDFLRECAKYHVYEIYCSLQTGAIGSARPAVALPQTTLERAKQHVALAHELGMQFDYIMNAPCFGNIEYSSEGRKRIREYLELIDELGADTISLATPYLIEIVKSDFPRLKIKVSEIADVDSAQRALFYQELGADILTMEINVNRDFKVLKSIREAIDPKIELEVVVNAACLFRCPFHDYHNVIVGHSGQEGHELHGYYVDYCMMRCIPIHNTRPKELIKARWIRPDDIHEYEEVGISRFKISNRVGPIKLGLACLKAYSSRQCDNMADLITPLSLNLEKPKGDRLPGFSNAEWEQMMQIWTIRPPDIYIDNRELNGFLDYFKKGNCYGQCDEGGCTYCAEVAKRVVKIDASAANKYAKTVDQIIAPILTLLPSRGSQLVSETSMWGPQISQLFEKLMESVPELFRDLAAKAIREKAESLARKRGASSIAKGDLAHAALSETPESFKAQVMETLKLLGVYCEPMG